MSIGVPRLAAFFAFRPLLTAHCSLPPASCLLFSQQARVFRAALGLTIDDAQWLRAEVLRIAQEGDARIGEVSQFGQKYIIDATLTRDEQTAIVRTAWIIENGKDFPRLITCYVK